MPFAIGVENADEFTKYLINVVVVTASVAWLFLLFVRSIDEKVYKQWKPFSVAMMLQLFFVTLRNLSTLLLSSGFAIPCQWIAVVGGVIYQLFAISAECAMLIRCRSFTRYPKMVTYLTIPTWVVRLGLCIWLVTTIKAPDNEAGFACDVVMDWNLSAIMQYFKIATEVVILVFFLERVIALHRSSRGMEVDSNHNHWRRLALINAGITFLVILFEVLVGQITVYLTGYLFLTYSLVNLIQATLVVFIVEDTKNVFKKRVASSNNASKQGHGNSSHSANHREGDSSTVSYADGVAAAKSARLHDSSMLPVGAQQPWSLTMRTPSVMPESIPVQYSPQHERPSSSFYDFGQVDQKTNPNRHWDIDVESQDTADSNRWRHSKAEDEIPMTLAKGREDLSRRQ
ncbi:hypothetical protein BG011_004745 [Mortierella polycephala]|uniref:Uncharacterized protein n=1 Tax=Mortierella polycephala TaxID=41804 RepID=A0A9P6U183_9FUNG|nr:hypothetical protein BG011_004745 [Mortierella polycephala]